MTLKTLLKALVMKLLMNTKLMKLLMNTKLQSALEISIPIIAQWDIFRQLQTWLNAYLAVIITEADQQMLDENFDDLQV